MSLEDLVFTNMKSILKNAEAIDKQTDRIIEIYELLVKLSSAVGKQDKSINDLVDALTRIVQHGNAAKPDIQNTILAILNDLSKLGHHDTKLYQDIERVLHERLDR